MADWIIITLIACAFIFAGGLFLVLFFRYRHWEKEQVARARAWQKHSVELLEELKREIKKELHDG